MPILLQQSHLLEQKPTKAAFALLGGWWWMLLMTAAYFHTWKEKLTGLATGLLGWAVIYKFVPRYRPSKQLVGTPISYSS